MDIYGAPALDQVLRIQNERLKGRLTVCSAIVGSKPFIYNMEAQSRDPSPWRWAGIGEH